MRTNPNSTVFAGLWLALVTTAGIATVSLASIGRLISDAEWTRQTHETQARLAVALSLLTDVQTATRGFAITGDDDFLQPYESALPLIAVEMQRIEGLVADNPAQLSRLAALRPMADRRLSLSARLVLLRREQGFAAAIQAVQTSTGKAVHDSLRAIVAAMQGEEQRLLAERGGRSRASSTRAIAVVSVSGLASLFFVILTMVIARRTFAALQRGEAQLRSSNADLVIATEQARAADRLKSGFLATMSHELRTPLNSIIGFTGILLQRLPGQLNPEQAKQLGMVQASASHLLDLINDILDISKIEAGELAVRIEPVDVSASVAKVVGVIAPLANAKGLVLDAHVAPNVGPLVGDARRIEQVVMNLLGNAVKFTERGKVTLTVDQLPHVLRFQVADTGIGIRPEALPTLFQPFQQLDLGLGRRFEGTGLGLAISRRLAELMSGQISVASTWGEGSVFTFTVPRHAAVSA